MSYESVTKLLHMHIESLADHPLLSAVISGWHFDKWGDRYPGTTRAAWTWELAGRCERNHIPIAVAAMVNAEPIGSASLVVCDMDARPELSPWLAAVYVLPILAGNRNRIGNSCAYAGTTVWCQKALASESSSCG